MNEIKSQRAQLKSFLAWVAVAGWMQRVVELTRVIFQGPTSVTLMGFYIHVLYMYIYVKNNGSERLKISVEIFTTT